MRLNHNLNFYNHLKLASNYTSDRTFTLLANILIHLKKEAQIESRMLSELKT